MTMKYILTSLIIFSMFTSFTHAETGYENSELSEQISKDFDSSQSCNCVSFRLDDVADYWLNDVQTEVIQTFRDDHIPLTIGIIGSEFGEDQKIVDYVKESIYAENSKIEIANHGWKHESFSTLDRNTQSNLIKKTNDRIFELLDISLKVFIPPFNEFNNDTIVSLEENGISHFSSALEMSNPPFPFQGLMVYNFPETATTGKYNPERDIFEKVDHVETFENINKSLDRFGYAVVTMHPQEFSILENGDYSNQPDFDKIKDLELLINKIQSSGLKIVLLSQINENVLENKIIIPQWFENPYVWWSEKKISNKTFANAIKFLQEHDITKLIIEKEYDSLTNFSLSKAIIEQKNIKQRDCSKDWTITGYYVPDESNFLGELKQVLVGNSEINYKTDFLEEVKIEGWGKTSQGYYLGWYDNIFHIHTFPLDVWENRLKVPMVAVDPNQIGLGTYLTIPSLPYPWGDVIFKATDIGTNISDRHIDVFVGEGSNAKQESFQLTSNDGRVCIVTFFD